MLFIYNQNNDPYFNLASEEYLMKHSKEDIFMLWRNHNTIVVGKNQNTLAEINYDYVKEHDISVVRRLSGGGAVYHDMGNINFTFILNSKDSFSDYHKFTKPIVDFLQTLGVNAQLKGRNDLVIDDKKFSGNAQYIHQNRILHHGTILYSASEDKLTNALKVSEDKIKTKGIQSIRSRITNISSHLDKPMPVEEFIQNLMDYMIKNTPDCINYDINIHREEIQKLADEKYSTWEWVYGYSPKYTFQKKARFDCGGVEVQLDVANDGIIQSAKIYGDFFSKMPAQELEEMFVGKRHNNEELSDCVKKINLSDYISGITYDEFMKLIL